MRTFIVFKNFSSNILLHFSKGHGGARSKFEGSLEARRPDGIDNTSTGQRSRPESRSSVRSDLVGSDAGSVTQKSNSGSKPGSRPSSRGGRDQTDLEKLGQRSETGSVASIRSGRDELDMLGQGRRSDAGSRTSLDHLSLHSKKSDQELLEPGI